MTPDEFAKAVGLNVQKARWLAGLTQEDAATAARISYRYFAETERGRRNPSLDVLLAIGNALGVTVADLVEIPEARPMRPPLFSRKAEPPPRGRTRR